MGKMPLIVAVAGAMWALPAFAEDGRNPIPSKPAVTLAQLDLCIGPDCRREREPRYYDRYDDDRRYRYDDDWRYRRGDRCREVTIRERRGDDIVVRRVYRCD
jgi:hypothetical protein